MRIEDVALFDRIVALGSIARGGNACGLSATVSSDRLKRLESDLSCTLLNRTTRSMSLTDEGVRFLPHAMELLRQFNETRHSVGKRATTPVGRLRIAAPMLFGRKFLPGPIETYLTSYPETQINLSLSDEIMNYTAEGIDVAIRIGRLTDSTFRASKLSENHRVLCASPCYLGRRGIPLDPSDLANHDCIVFLEENQWHFRKDGQDSHVKVQGRFNTNSAEMATQACLDSLGIALRSTWDISDALDDGRLVQVLPDHKVPSDMSIYAIYPPGRFISQAAKTFVALMKEQVNGTVTLLSRGRDLID